MKYIYILLLIAAISFNLQAQSNFKPGYIVTLKGDTTKGFIGYKDWLENPRSVDFKPSENAAVQQYSPGRIKAFDVNGIDHYVSYNGGVSTGSVQLSDLSSGINRSKITDTIFLRTIIEGSKVTLYSYNDVVKNRFFIAEANTVPTELERYVYRDNSSNSNIVESNVYQQQLKIIADKYQPGNTALANRVQRATYQTRELEKIIAAINGLNEVHKTTIAEREYVQYFVGAAANLNQTAFSGNDYSGLKEGLFASGVNTQSIGPSFNGGLDYYFNKNSGKFIFRMELSVAINKITGSYEQPFADNLRVFTRKETFNANQLNASLNPQFIYNIINDSKLKFYFAGGIQFNKTYYSSSYYYIDFYENNALNKRNERPVAFRGLFLNPTTRAGIILPNIAEIYLGYNPPAEILNDSDLSGSLSTFKLGVNYRFGKK